jgi:hypothetical protein
VFILEPSVAETTTTTGTGDLTLGSALPTTRTFNAAVGVGWPVGYAIRAVDANGLYTGGDFEIGIGYLSAASTFVRLAVLRSSNSNNAVNWGAGTKHLHLIDTRSWLDWEGDDFISAALATTGNISRLAWGVTASTAGTYAFQAGTDGHPGIFRITTSTTANSIARLHRGSSATAGGLIVPANLAVMTAVIRLLENTSMAFRFGLGQDWGSTTLGTAGAWIEFDAAASANWRFATRQASVGTPSNSTQAVAANTWYRLAIVHYGSGVAFFSNGALLGTLTANLPTTVCQAGFQIINTTTTARNLDIDYYSQYLRPLARS